MTFFYFLSRIVYIIKNIIYYRLLFGAVNYRSIIKQPLKIDCGKNIFLGKVTVGYKSWLAANPLTDSNSCKLIIGDGSCIGNFNHIYATEYICLENNVLTADKVYITDNLHSYTDINIPINYQPIKQLKHVVIGEGSWLGENVCIIGASIGKHCVIGANSVVTHDIPDYCVAVGAPAYVIKRYNLKTQQWEKTDKKGNFLQQ